MARVLKDCVLYDNYGGYDFEELKEELISNTDMEENEISDSAVWDYMTDLMYEDWRTVMSELESPYCILCVGSFGSWQGTFPGGKLFYGESIENIIKNAGEDCEYFKIYTDKKGNLNVTCSHHDGQNCVEFYEVNDKGQKYIENHSYMSDRELHKHLINSNMTKQIKVFERG